jgi:hypothetical protein
MASDRRFRDDPDLDLPQAPTALLGAPGRLPATARLGLMRAARGTDRVAARAEDDVDRAAGTSGAPLPGELRARFESSLGADLSGVRVHTGAESETAARAVGAKAYAIGNDIHFGAGYYDTSSSSGQFLIAHEVAHTVQQAGAAPTRQYKLEVSSPGDHAETEADHVAHAMVAGQRVTVGSATPGALHRKAGSSDDEPYFQGEIAKAPTREALLDIKDALLDAKDADVNVDITYQCEEYTVSVQAKARLLAQIDVAYKSKYGGSHPYENMTFDQRCQDALTRKDQERLAYLNDVIREMVTWNLANDEAMGFKGNGAEARVWKVACDDEELRIDKALLLGWQKRLSGGTAPSSVDDKVPSGVSLQQLRFGFMIAPNKTVGEGLSTGKNGSKITIRVSRTKAEVTMSPGLEAGPFGAAGTLDAVTLTFGTGTVHASASGALDGTIASDTEAWVVNKLAGSGLEVAGYDPFADDLLENKLAKLGEGGSSTEGLNAPTDLSEFNAGAEINLKDGFSELDDKKTGLVVAAGSHFSLWAQSAGSLKSAGPDVKEMKSLTVASNGITIQKEGAPVARIKKLRVDRGGTVTIEDIELLGEAKSAGDWESFLRLLAGAAKASNAGMPDDAAIAHGAKEMAPALVKGLTKHEIEQKLTAAIGGLIRQNADTEIGGMKLSKIVGM